MGHAAQTMPYSQSRTANQMSDRQGSRAVPREFHREKRLLFLSMTMCLFCGGGLYCTTNSSSDNGAGVVQYGREVRELDGETEDLTAVSFY